MAPDPMNLGRRCTVATIALGLAGPWPVAWGAQRIEVAAFDAIESRLAADLRMKPAVAASVVVDAEPRVLAALRVRVEGRRLILDASSYRTSRPLRVDIGFVSLRQLQLVGSDRCELEGLRADAFELLLDGAHTFVGRGLNLGALRLDSRGSDDVQLAGRCERMDLALAGSGSVAALGLDVATATAALTGSGDAGLSVKRRLDVRLDGSGSLRYRGRPKLVRTGDGSGDVQETQ